MNSTRDPESSSSKGIHQRFESYADKTGDRVAIVCGDRGLTYEQLNRQANRVARALIECGVRVGDRVGLHAERGFETVIAMLGTLKAGAAYVPLDPDYPAQRVTFMREDASLAAVLTTSSLVSKLPALEIPTLTLDGDLAEFAANPELPSLTSNDLAYVIYTSGSTGRPKGVMVEHGNVLGLVIKNTFAPIDFEDRVAHCASPSFDATTWEVWATLLNGGTLVVVPQEVVLSPAAFNLMLVKQGVTALWITTGLFNEYVDALQIAFSGLKYLLTGGDVLPPSIVARVLQNKRRPGRLLNAYGPTETTTFATTFEIKDVESSTSSIPIGKPIDNTYVYILTEEMRPVSTGEVGEIYIGGGGVSRGYLNMQKLTDERFLRNPFDETSRGKLYKTGDLGRWRADGNIEFLGRKDRQVKIRGFRVELGELEAALQGAPGVKQAVVVADEATPGAKRLVAYIVPGGSSSMPVCAEGTCGEESASLIEGVRRYLAKLLPPYMIPGVIIPLKCLPLTANGKVDRNALPAPELQRRVATNYCAPTSSVEEFLVSVWEKALKVNQVGVEDNFFELGGDSLAGLEMIGKLANRLGINLPFAAVYRHPTVRELAVFIEKMMAKNRAEKTG